MTRREKKELCQKRSKALKQKKKWNEENKEHCKEYRKNYYQENKERGAILNRMWRKVNLRYTREYMRVWRANNPEKARGIDLRHQNKRKRSLGFEPLNRPSENSVAHHLDRIYVIYMPEELHRSIPHCLETGRNMIRINTLALNFALN